MSNFFYGIQDLFENVLFLPFHGLRFMQSWWASNGVNWLFILIGIVALAYWLKQLSIFSKEGTEDTSSTSHSYL